MKIFFLILVIVGVAWNLRSFHSLERGRADALKQASAPDVALAANGNGNGNENEMEMINGVAVIPWTLLEQTKYSPGEKPQFPPALRALEGRQATITGAVFSIKTLEKDGKTKGALMMPLAKIGCCSGACANDPRTMLFVSCEKNPMPLPKARFTAAVTGQLSLSNDDAAWGLFALEDASAEKFESIAEAHK